MRKRPRRHRLNRLNLDIHTICSFKNLGYGSTTFILLLVKDGLPHAVHVLAAWVLPLLEGYVGGHSNPSLRALPLAVSLPRFLLFEVGSSPFLNLCLLCLQELFKLLSRLLLPLLLQLVLMVLHRNGDTDFCRSCSCRRYSSSLTLLTVSNSSADVAAWLFHCMGSSSFCGWSGYGWSYRQS